jgi:hypothetical protein
MVPGAGLEPAHTYVREILSLLCLPIPPPGLREVFYRLVVPYLCEIGGATRSRTGLNGFAIRSITALLSRHLERETRLELATSTLARLRSTN